MRVSDLKLNSPNEMRCLSIGTLGRGRNEIRARNAPKGFAASGGDKILSKAELEKD